MSWLSKFLRSSIGGKLVMSLTGLVLIGFVVGHLAGNLLVYGGPAAMDDYAAFLKGKPALVWTVRVLLLVCLAAHVATAVRLQQGNRAARPVRYVKAATVQATLASRSMMGTGFIVLLYVVYHLLHFTVGVTDADLAAYKNDGQVYRMVVAGFGSVPVALVYVAANGMLAWHLSHGISSFFQTVGVSDPRYQPLIEKGGLALAALIGAGFISIPVSVQLGLLTPP